MTRPAAIGPGVYLDAHSCVLLSRLLTPLVHQIGASQLAEVLPALRAIGLAADGERVAAAGRLRVAPDLTGWLSTADVAVVLGVSTRAVRKAIAAGRLPAQRSGRGWLVDAAALDR